MNRINKLAAPVAAAMTFATLISASAFADSRHRDETYREGTRGGVAAQRSITMEGRVTSINHERDGYRVQLDRGGYSYFVPGRNSRGLDLRVGINIRLTGVFDSRGDVYVSNADYIDDGYNNRYDNKRGELRGIVQDVDARRGTALVRDEYSGRSVTIVMSRDSRRGRGVDLDDLRRGDRVTFDGDWSRGVFEAWRIDSVSSGRRR